MNEANRDRAPTLAERWQALRRRGGPQAQHAPQVMGVVG